MLSSFFKRLLMGRQLEFTEGDIEILDTKFTMHSLSHYFNWRETVKGRHDGEGLKEMYDIGKMTGKEMAKSYKDKFKIGGGESANFWKNLLELSGLGKVQVISPQEGGKVLIQIESAFARHYTNKKGKGEENVDEYLVGMLTGVFEEMYERELVGKETKCTAIGQPYCEIIIKPLEG